VHVCKHACVVRKQRVEVYLHPDTVAQLESDYDGGKSEVIRNAVNDMLGGSDD